MLKQLLLLILCIFVKTASSQNLRKQVETAKNNYSLNFQKYEELKESNYKAYKVTDSLRKNLLELEAFYVRYYDRNQDFILKFNYLKLKTYDSTKHESIQVLLNNDIKTFVEKKCEYKTFLSAETEFQIVEKSELKNQLKEIELLNKKIVDYNVCLTQYQEKYIEVSTFIPLFYDSLLTSYLKLRNTKLKNEALFAEVESDFKANFKQQKYPQEYFQLFQPQSSDENVEISDFDRIVTENRNLKNQKPADRNAEFIGGKAALESFLKENLIPPTVNGKQHFAGKSIVLFQVSKEGIVNTPKVIKGVPNCEACDQESIRLVLSMPKMQAAIKNGEAIDSYYSIIIPFNVED
jgi:hypothetical protein